MAKYSFLLLVLSLVACSGGSGGGVLSDNTDSTETNKTTRSSVTYTDTTKDDPNERGVIRTLVTTFDYYNTDGIQSFVKDLTINTSNAGKLTVTSVSIPSCPGGGHVNLRYQLFRKDISNEQETDFELTPFNLGDTFWLRQFSHYFVRTQAEVIGGCIGLNMAVTSVIKIRY